MAFYKVKIRRECNSTRSFNVKGEKAQDAIIAAASQLRDEGVNDACGIEIIGKINSLRD